MRDAHQLRPPLDGLRSLSRPSTTHQTPLERDQRKRQFSAACEGKGLKTLTTDLDGLTAFFRVNTVKTIKFLRYTRARGHAANDDEVG